MSGVLAEGGFWDGTGSALVGALLGGVVSTGLALLVFVLTRKHDREMHAKQVQHDRTMLLEGRSFDVADDLLRAAQESLNDLSQVTTLKIGPALSATGTWVSAVTRAMPVVIGQNPLLLRLVEVVMVLEKFSTILGDAQQSPSQDWYGKSVSPLDERCLAETRSALIAWMGGHVMGSVIAWRTGDPLPPSEQPPTLDDLVPSNGSSSDPGDRAAVERTEPDAPDNAEHRQV